jgi:hypothetical protein
VGHDSKREIFKYEGSVAVPVKCETIRRDALLANVAKLFRGYMIFETQTGFSGV